MEESLEESLKDISSNSNWVSLYAFFDGKENDIYNSICDRIILNVVKPVIEEVRDLANGFFIYDIKRRDPTCECG